MNPHSPSWSTIIQQYVASDQSYIPQGYLQTTKSPLSFCYNEEGWGPMSPFRWDFTPCFLDVWLLVVAAFGIVLGSGANWYLHKKCPPQPTPKDWHFFAKLSVLALVIADLALQAALLIEYLGPLWVSDFRFWASIALLISTFIILYIQYIEHWRSRVPNGVVLFYWLLLIIAFGVKLRSLVEQNMQNVHPAFFITFTVGLGLSAIEFGLEYLIPKKMSVYQSLEDEYECPYAYADVFSVLTFSWMTPLMKAGYKNFLTQDDLWNLRERDTSEATSEAFEKAWKHELRKKKPNLWFAMARAYGGPYLRGALVKVPSDICQFIQPFFLRMLINFVGSFSAERDSLTKGWAISLTMFAVSIVATISLNQYFSRAIETGMRVKSGLTGAIYAKTMRLSNEARALKKTGDIVNHMSVDAQRLQDLMQFLQQGWSAPFQITLCMIFLYQILGVSMLAGVAIMILMVPINGLLTKIFKDLQETQMKQKDERTSLTTEILNNMKSIKLYAWNAAFMKKLTHVRNDLELNTLRKIGASQALVNMTFQTTPFLVSCATFSLYALTHDTPLTVDLVFPALALFNLLNFPLIMLPNIITYVAEAFVTVGRLTKFLLSSELQDDAIQIQKAVNEHGQESVTIREGTFTWDQSENRRTLHNINFSANKGELTCVVGRVGCGKTSLLSAMLGELYKIEGHVIVRGMVAYAAQTPWIMNGSIKENIVFGYRYEPDFYRKTVKACALEDDFSMLANGDETLVGERGISLSGGQKARVSLARAVYARADIYILDDVLSAVDQHVGRHIVDNVLGKDGLLSGKTRILATNSTPVLSQADCTYLLKEGKVVEKGTYSQLLAIKGDFANIVNTGNSEESIESPLSTPTSSEVEEDIIGGNSSSEGMENGEEDNLTALQPIQHHINKARATSFSTLRRASSASNRISRFKATTDDLIDSNGQNREKAEQGKVKWSVYAAYASSANSIAVISWLAVLVVAQAIQIGGSIWLKQWSEDNAKTGGNSHAGKYIGMYFGFGFAYSGFVLAQTLLLWIFCSIEASRKLHERMAFAIFRAPMSFFETTPVGRILNRFSSDISRIDEVIARNFNQLFTNLTKAIFTLVTISVATPLFSTLILPLAVVYFYIQRYYLRSSRELKRLESVSRSPVFSHFQESITGASTIRAFRQIKRFEQESEFRVDEYQRAYFPGINANRWLAIRLEFIGSAIILFASAFAVIGVGRGDGPSAGLLGLAMAYALQITQSLNWIVRQTVEVETNIVAVERVLEYANIPSEAPEVIQGHRPAASWPANGDVTFKNYNMRYRPELDLVLNNINLSFKPREKIGIVGRTGAGKSSLTLALFRIIEGESGSICIDDLDISKIGLMDLRTKLAIIPQDASISLFKGTIRDNLDPGLIHDDSELWSALDHADLKEYVSSLPGKLEAQINEGGSNLSAGQGQLISLARALLAPSNIFVLDEATAAVDVVTDSVLQKTLRGRLRDKTIITIAHRINTILDSDRVVVLKQGKVVEFDTPANLVKQQGHFYELVKESNLLGAMGASEAQKH